MNYIESYGTLVLMVLCVIIIIYISIFSPVKKGKYSYCQKNQELNKNMLEVKRNLTSTNINMAGSAFMFLLTYGIIVLCSLVNNSDKYNVKNDKAVFEKILRNKSLMLLSKDMSKIPYRG